MKVSLFITCLGDFFYPEVGKDVIELLEKFGCDVDFPEKQTCCGQPAFNSGYHRETEKVAKHMIETFEDAEIIVTPSGSCAAMLKEYPDVFKNNKEWRLRAEHVAEKTYELTQFLYYVLQVKDTGGVLTGTAVYHTSCHMSRLLGETEAPYQLLAHVKGLELIDLPNKHHCCGFGGTFAVKMNRISQQMVDEKIGHVEESGADIVIGADSGCLMNIGGRIGKEKKPIKLMHIAQVLNHKEG